MLLACACTCASCSDRLPHTHHVFCHRVDDPGRRRRGVDLPAHEPREAAGASTHPTHPSPACASPTIGIAPKQLHAPITTSAGRRAARSGHVDRHRRPHPVRRRARGAQARGSRTPSLARRPAERPNSARPSALLRATHSQVAATPAHNNPTPPRRSSACAGVEHRRHHR